MIIATEMKVKAGQSEQQEASIPVKQSMLDAGVNKVVARVVKHCSKVNSKITRGLAGA